MLKVTKSNPLVTEGDAVSDEELGSPAELLASFISFVRRQYPIILGVVALTICLSVAYLLTTPPSFTAQATMIIDTRKVQLFQQQSMQGDTTVNNGMAESQVEILKSESVSAAVIKELHLTDDPEFVGSGGGFLGALIRFVSGGFAAEPAKSEFEVARRAAEAFAERLTVRRIGVTYLIQISFRSRDPDRAAQIANAVAEAYIVDQLEAKYQATRRASVWLQDRIKELRDQASAAERAVVEFKEKNNIVNTGGSNGRLVSEQQLSEINSQLTVARAQVSEARARLTRIDSILHSDAPEGTVADTLNSSVISKLRSQYLDLANREADWSARYGSSHLAAVNLRNQMRGIRSSILDELRRIAETYRSDYEIAKQREADLQKRLDDAVRESQTTSQAQVVLHELESSAQTYRSLYDNFLQRYMESVQQQTFPITEARVVTAASRPLVKSHPKSMLILAMTSAAGLLLGLGLARLRDLSDRVFRTAKQVESLLHTDCISMVPNVKSSELKPGQSSRQTNDMAAPKIDGPRQAPALRAVGSTVARTIGGSHKLLQYIVNSPLSRYAESIRSIKAATDLYGGGASQNRVIGITSTLPNEGKSTISASLAQLSAHAGARTILVDGDLRNPSLTRLLAPSAKAGLMEVISGKAALSDVIWTDPSTNLVFLPAVVRHQLVHTNEVLASNDTKRLFDQLRASYDYIILDLSPLAPVVDVRMTAHLVDSYIFVIEWGRTRLEAVEKALKGARSVRENLTGVVLNKADIKVVGRYEGYGGYYNNKYYSQYGLTE